MRIEYSPRKVAVVGLGYVGLPVAKALAAHYTTVGFDIDESRVSELANGYDRNGEVSSKALIQSRLELTSDPSALNAADFVVVSVPTPIDSNRQPDLGPLTSATRIVAGSLASDTVVVFESTVYPGVTEEILAPLIQTTSGLARCQFKLGYSPERINPGDGVHTLSSVVKVVSGEDDETREKIASVYSRIVSAGIFRATSIKVAEAAKVIENIQRDINIALMNELAIIFERLGISTREVLDAACTKWNFTRYSPGLVGGHCIGVDPYYLTAKAEAVGYYPQMILAGRRINDNMSAFVAQKLVKMLIAQNVNVKDSRVAIFGVTFKENVTDYRNSQVFPLIRELESFGVKTLAHDPNASPRAVERDTGVVLLPLEELTQLDGVVVAVPHREYLEPTFQEIDWRFKGPGVLLDVRAAFESELPPSIAYWCL